jgi:hypothetical protein
VNSRAWRNHRLRNRAWALVAALLSSTECWAMDGQEPAAADPQTTSPTSAASNPGSIDTRSTRRRIPPPRQFSAEELQARGSTLRPGGPNIPPPRQFVTSSNAQQPVFAPVQSQPQDVGPHWGPVSDRPAQPPDVPKTGPGTAEIPAPGEVAGAAANTSGQPWTPQGSSSSPETGVAPASVSLPRVAAEHGADTVGPQAALESPASSNPAEPDRQKAGSPKARLGSATSDSPVDPSVPAASTEATGGAMPVPVQQAIETLAKPPVAEPASASDAIPGLEVQPLPQAEQVNPRASTGGPHPTSTPEDQAPAAKEDKPSQGLDESAAAQQPIQTATGLPPSGGGSM